MNTFKEAHKPISKHLFTDVGLTLQKKDSDIMNAILMSLMKKSVKLSKCDLVLMMEEEEHLMILVILLKSQESVFVR